MAVYAYCRVWTERAANDGESLGAQQRTVEGYAMMHGLKVDHVFVERGVSGSKPLSERAQGAKLLATLQPGDIIVTSKLDRMFRSARNALHVLDLLKTKGVSLHMIDLGGDVTGNGISRLVFTILSAVAEAERERIRERVSDVKRDQKQRNRFLGGSVPFGWRVTEEKELVEVPEQQTAIREMVRLKRKGHSLRMIAALLQKKGFAVSHMTVKTALERASKP